MPQNVDEAGKSYAGEDDKFAYFQKQIYINISVYAVGVVTP